MSKVIVVGAGPCWYNGCNLTSSKHNEVILIERNNELGRKDLDLTGGGRCNITNNRDIDELFFDKVVNNNKFLYSSHFILFSNY